MNLQERLLNDMKTAMKQKELGKEKLSVIRMARAAIKNEEINKKKVLNDDEVIQVLSREIKQRKDSMSDYERANRMDIIEKLKREVVILQEYLPEQMDEAEVESLVKELIVSTEAKGPQDMGKVMKVAMSAVAGRTDGRLVNQIVRQLLAK